MKCDDAPLYPLRFRDLRSVERIVINSRASLGLGAANRYLHRATATLKNGRHHEQSSIGAIRQDDLLIHVDLRMASEP